MVGIGIRGIKDKEEENMLHITKELIEDCQVVFAKDDKWSVVGHIILKGKIVVGGQRSSEIREKINKWVKKSSDGYLKVVVAYWNEGSSDSKGESEESFVDLSFFSEMFIVDYSESFNQSDSGEFLLVLKERKQILSESSNYFKQLPTPKHESHANYGFTQDEVETVYGKKSLVK